MTRAGWGNKTNSTSGCSEVKAAGRGRQVTRGMQKLVVTVPKKALRKLQTDPD